MKPERLQKIIAAAGFASRREAEEMIRSGRVTLNGRTVTELGTKAVAESDHIKVDGKLLTRAEEHRYLLLYKPKEVMTTVSDPEGRKTVLDLIRGVKERIYPVGRLDFHSEGLIVLTNDGELAYKISHPTHGSVKTYHVKVRGVPEERLIDKLRRGITIDGRRTLPCEISRIRTTGRSDDEGNSWFEIHLREGRTQQIRKMYKALGHPVSKLKRVAIGPISDGRLTVGQWRELTPQEVKLLATQMSPKAPRPVVKRRPSSGRPAASTKGRGSAGKRSASGRKLTASKGPHTARRGASRKSARPSRPAASRKGR